jgi:hypothetical protein
MYNYNTVSDEASHSNRSWCKFLMIKKRRFISIAWPVAMTSLPLNTEQCLYKNTICSNYRFNATFKATPITEQPNNLLMGRQNLLVDIYV